MMVFFNISIPAWLNNCVGHFNHRYFFSYCLFMTLGCVYCSISGRNLFLDAYNALEVRCFYPHTAGMLSAACSGALLLRILSVFFLFFPVACWVFFCTGLTVSDWHCFVSVLNTWGCSWLLLHKRLKHLDVEKPGVPVTGMGVLIGLLPSGQVLFKHSTYDDMSNLTCFKYLSVMWYAYFSFRPNIRHLHLRSHLATGWLIRASSTCGCLPGKQCISCFNMQLHTNCSTVILEEWLD